MIDRAVGACVALTARFRAGARTRTLGWETASRLLQNGPTRKRAPGGGRSLLRIRETLRHTTEVGETPRPHPK